MSRTGLRFAQVCRRFAASFGMLALVANIMAPAAFAAAGARADAAMFASPFAGSICHAAAPDEAPAAPAVPDCPLCPLPAAMALSAASSVPVPVPVRWTAIATALAPVRVAAFEIPSRHRPRAPPSS